jgi:natural product biosynthesis luciferase-like monooxygenase protein/amino acid adenylation domain-containing protein
MSQAEVLIDSPRKARVLESLKTLVNELTGINPAHLDIHANFLEAGIDSLTLIQATQLVKEQFDVKLSVVQLLEQLSNIDSLASYIDQQLPPEPAVEMLTSTASNPPAPDREPPKIAPPPPPPAAPVTPIQLPEIRATGLDQIMSQQLQIMSQQLEMLRTTTQIPQIAKPDPPAPAITPRPAVTLNQPTFVPYQPIEPGPTDGLTDRQRKHLDDLIARHTARTRESKRLTQEFRPHLADSRTSFGFRLLWKEMVYPLISDRSSGSKVWDVDGNEYVDIAMGFGIHLFGHSPDFVDAAFKRQIEQKRLQLGPQILLAGKVARLISELAKQERVNFCNSGTEAVMGALRIARTVTRRSRIALFAGAYHGWSDLTLAKIVNSRNEQRTVPVGPGISANTVEDIVVLGWDQPESIDYLRKHAHELAAVLVEPVQSRRPDIQPREFLHQLREITSRTGTALILDEMITGFRIHSGGAQAWFGVQADISIYGKVIGGGLPVGIIAGKAKFMDAFDGGMWNYGDGSYPEAEKTLFAGAFFKHPLTMAAAEAILERLRDEPSLLPELNERTGRLVARLNRYFEDADMPITVVNFGSLFRFMFAPELKYVDLFFYHMLAHGVFIWEGRNCFLSTAHTEEDLDRIVRAVAGSVEQMRAGGFWPEPPGKSNGDTAASEVRVETTAGPSSRAPASSSPAGNGGPGSTANVTVTEQRATVAAVAPQLRTAPKFSLYYFGNYDSDFSNDKYELLFRGARYADEHDFHAVWIPERHFHAFGGFSPNPSVVAAALARETRRLRINAGSVVLPLHNPIRVAEEWSVVDNLSHGRIGISFASGWQPNDFVFAPDAYATRRDHMLRGIEVVQKLWSGEPIQTRSGDGKEISVRLTPMPMQRKLPIWLTGGNVPTFVKAGELGAGILTNLQSLSIEELSERLAIYRQTLERNGHDPASGHCTLLLHTFVVPDLDEAREKARRPLHQYMKSSLGLMGNLVKKSSLKPVDFEKLSDEDLEYFLSTAYNRYTETASLIGTPQSCVSVVDRLIEIGVDEIGCMVDFGIDTESVVASLDTLNTLRAKYESKPAEPLPITVQTAEVKSIPLTDAQRQLWITTQIGPDASRAYNESVTLTMRGPFDPDAMRQALWQLIERHEELRATFTADGPAQLIHPSLVIDIPLIDFSHVDAGVREAEVQEWITREVGEPFDLEHGPLVRFHIIKLDSGVHLLVLGNHHLVADGQSWGVLLADLEALYAAARTGTKAQLPPPRTFAEFADRQRQIQHEKDARASEEYWVELFAESVPVLYLPTDRPRPPVQTYNGNRLMIRTGPTLFTQLKHVCAEQGSTVYMMLLAAYSALLHRLSRQEKLIVGVPAAGQVAVGHKNTVGYCINLLPLLSDAGDDPTFAEFLTRTKRRLMEGLEHQHYSFGNLLKRLDIPWDASHAPLFTTTFNVDRSERGRKFFDLEFDAAPNPMHWSSDELRMSIIEADDELVLDCIYNTDLFDESTIRRWMDHFQTLLAAIARDSRQPLWHLPLLSETQRGLLLQQRREQSVRPDAIVHGLFEAQVEANPQAVAIQFGSQAVTYGELNQRANALARRLIDAGVGRGVFVGLCTERSIEAVVGMLGVLKAGGAYVHLDPAYPPERLRFIIEDTRARILLAEGKFIDLLPSSHCEVLQIETNGKTDQTVELPRVPSDQAAYVYYTSGSTGQPKGVVSTHAAVVNFLNYVLREHRLSAGDVVLQVAALSFDASVRDILGPLAAGAKAILPDETDAKDPAALIAAIERHRVTCLLSLVPARLSGLLNSATGTTRDLSSLRLLLLSGEHLPLADCRRVWQLFGDQVSIVNQYGPTECTMISTFQRVTPTAGAQGNALAGMPIDNVHVRILDEHLELSPPGVPGEVFIGGEGLARGYLNRPDLTAERFIAHPHSTTSGARIYRTGDLGRLLPGGELEILGRLDHQLKIRGLRIEPAEIEVVLAAHPSVREAVVVAREDVPNDKRLVAYVVSRTTGAQPASSELRAFLRERLPEYMEPSAFVFLSELPLSRNGKVDRQALPAPEARLDTGAAAVGPRNDLEQRLRDLWGEVLMIEGFGIDDDFFELGGNSLLGTQLLARIRDTFSIELPLRSLFEKPTVAGLAAEVEEFKRAEQSSIEPQIERISRDEELPLSFAQQRLWFISQLDPNNRAYNVRGGIRLQGELNVRALEQSLNEIIRRHEVLRTRFAASDGRPYQVIAPSLTFHLPVIDLRDLPSDEREAKAKEIAIEEAERLFDLSRCPLLRLSLFRLDDNDHALAYSLHHIICDGWSMGILINEISLLYMAFSTGNASPLPELEIQYADFANWQQQWLQGEVLDTQLSYWKKQLAAAPAELVLPTDFPRPPVRSYRGARYSMALPSGLSQALRDLSQQEGVTLFMTLLAAYQVLLSRYTNETDIVVGSDIANRNLSATQTLIGFFVNQIVLRTDLSDNPNFIELLGRVRETALEAYANQDLPFEKLVEAMEPERHLNRSPLFQVKFLLQNTPQDSELSLRGLTLRPFNFDIEASTFDLLLSMLDTEQGLRGTFEYSTDLFVSETIERFGAHFHHLLQSIVANPRQRVSDIQFLSAAEQQQLLVEWNETSVEYPKNRCIHQLFEAQVERTPEAVAVAFEEEKLTYRELNSRANQLAHHLRQLGVERETLVGLCVERSPAAVIGILGTLKAGAAFVPLDPGYPLERLSFMLEDARVPVLLTQEALLERVPAQWVQTISLDTEWDGLIANQNEANVATGALADNLAYVIYTSGSTGKPKAVMVQHAGLCNMVQAQIKAFGVTADSRVLQFASLSFDASVSEIFMALLSGAGLYLASRESLMPGRPLLKLLRENEITTVTLPPSVLAVMDSDELPALQTIVAAGEACPPETVARWRKGRRFIDAYGPTEDTVCATLAQLDGDRVTIGKPIANNQIYILDATMQPAPAGVYGELHIGGVGLARGYLNRPALTAEKFVPNPFSAIAGERLYKSGDLARWLADGNLEFAGRIDDQLKIRGYRIEAGEIESVLNEHPDVRTSVVLERQDEAGEKRLAAYCVRQNLDDGPLLNLDGSENGRVELWPSVAEFYVYDDLLYHAMTADQRRNESYKVAINRHVQDKVVLDLGTGKDAILARFCVEAGAARVYAIELLDESYQKAKETIENLGLSDKIILIQGNSMAVELPERIDVCVSEIVGPIGGCEGAAAIINDAWRFMKDDGVMIPSRSVTKIAAITLSDDFLANPTFSRLSAQYAEKVFEQVGHRFDLRLCMKNFSPENIISNAQPFEALDFMQRSDAEFDREIELVIERDEKMVGFVVWLNLHTVEDEVINILEHEYCWLPVYLPTFYPGVEVRAGDRIKATISGRFSDNQLNLDYTIKGSLLRQSGARSDFEYTTYHHRAIFQATDFYRRIFPDGRINILEGFQPQVLIKKLKTYLKDVLPEYMIPADVVILDSLPVTPNGKIDRKALPDPGQMSATALHEYVAPRNALESQLAAMWEDLLGIRPVGVRESFFELGGHSLLAVRLMARIKKQFGLDLPISSLFRGETIEEFAKILGEQSSAWRSSPVVPIQPSGTRRPFFCVHAMGGNVNNYYLLARYLGSDQPFYGLQAPPLTEAEDEPVESMAQRYIEALREVQPAGPYLLGGYSFGSFVAYEMARQLESQGERIDLLALFDTYSPSILQQLSPYRDIADMLVALAWTTAREQGKELLLSADELRKLSLDEQFDFFLERMRAEGLAPPEVDRELLARFLQGSAARERAAHNYAPQKYAGNVTVFKCAQRDQLWLQRLAQAGLEANDATLGWGALAQSVNVVEIAGHHDVICQEPYVQSLAESLRSSFDAATVETKAASAA